MEQVSNLANGQQRRFGKGLEVWSSEESTWPSAWIPEAHVDQLFVEMQVIYGGAWTSRFPDDRLLKLGKRTWAKVLAGKLAEDLRRGMDSAPDEYPSMPPNPGEFAQLCKKPFIRTSHKEFPKTESPRPPRDTEAGLAAIAEIKKVLGGSQHAP